MYFLIIAVVIRCIKNKFHNENCSSKDFSFRYNLVFGKKEVALDIVDYNNKNDALISHADGYIICYSINDKQSFKDITMYLDKILDANMKQPKIALVGNKSDLYLERQVPSSAGNQFAKDIDALFYETSARIPVIDIRQIFYDLFKAIKSSNKLKKTPRNSFDFGSQLDLHSLFNHSAMNPIGYTNTGSRKTRSSNNNNVGYFSKTLKRFSPKADIRKSSLDIYF